MREEMGTMRQEPHVGELCWHVHHDVLCEVLIEPIGKRIAYIRENKPEHEIELRLKLMKPVVGPLPECVAQAWAEYDKVRAKCDKVWAEYDKVRAKCDKVWAEYDKVRAKCDKVRAECDKVLAEYVKARAEYYKAQAEYYKALSSREMDALHAIECPDCPWDGKTIFPERGDGDDT